MAYIFYNKIWESEFDNIVSQRDEIQDANINQLKLEVHDTCKEDQKLTTDFEPIDKEDVINKAYFDEKLKKIDSHIVYTEKDYNEFKLQYNEQNVEDISMQRVVKTMIQILHDKGLLDNYNYANADKVLEDFLITTRRKGDLEEIKDDVQ